MPCYHPLKGFRSRNTNANGKRTIVFNTRHGYSDLPIVLPCGQCIGCRLERSRQWAIRCLHEASLHDQNCFITLTFSDEHIPSDLSLDIAHFTNFMKRLRKKYGPGIRFYHCGEYGEQNRRPHYHACLFNHDFKDKELYKTTNGHKLYISKELEQLWPYGFSLIGQVTFESAAYVARYIMKKVTGSAATDHYETYDLITGEIKQLKPEYTTMSRRPGIGKEWLTKFQDDIFPDDFVIINGKKMRPPRYYDRQYEIKSPSKWQAIRGSRVLNAKKHTANNTPQRLAVRETVQQARLDILPRKLEKET